MGTRKQILSILLAVFCLTVVGARQTPQSKTATETPKQTADVVIRAGAIHTMAQGRPTTRSIAIGGGRVLAVGGAAHALDVFIGGSTQVIDDSALTLLPGFIDTHTPHLRRQRH